MKKRLVGIAAVSIFTLGMGALAFASQPIKLILNNKVLETDVAPQIVQGRVLVPIRAISEALNIGIAWDSKSQAVSIYANKGENEQQRILQLERALAAKDPLEAVKTWADGVKTRNGAAQYAVMSPELRKEKLAKFSENFWSTGVSSPWVDNYEIIEKASGDDGYTYQVVFTYTDSTQSTFTENQLVEVKKIDDNWVISNIDG